jgi:hypothetical protein
MHSHLKPMMLTIAVIALLAGLVGCAKYPVVTNASAPTPTAAAPAPVR